MGQKRKWVQKIADGTRLYGEALPGQTIIEIADDRRVLVERHSGVVEYGINRICIRAKYGMICVTGSRLELTQMSREQLVISGQIESVQIQRGCSS